MRSPSLCKGWLERAGQPPVPIGATCGLGRASSNQVVLSDPKVSRCHALIQSQSRDEFWLVDFGSVNGTWVNGRRVTHPTLLNNGDQIVIGGEALTFRKESRKVENESCVSNTVTLVEVRTLNCWLLLADIKSSTQLIVRRSAEELPVLFGNWFASCQETIDGAMGQINKFLGDGFLAYWSEPPSAVEQVKRAVQGLCQAQSHSHLPFRWVLHYGPVTVGGAMAMSEASLVGREVNFAFRMEKLAGKLGHDRLLSQAACDQLGLVQSCERTGPQEVGGYDGLFDFYTF